MIFHHVSEIAGGYKNPPFSDIPKISCQFGDDISYHIPLYSDYCWLTGHLYRMFSWITSHDHQPTHKVRPGIRAPLSCLQTCLTLFREPTMFPKWPWKWTDINAACRRIHWTTSLKWTLLCLSSYACEREYVYVGVWGCCTSFVCPLYCIHWLLEVMNIHNRFGLPTAWTTNTINIWIRRPETYHHLYYLKLEAWKLKPAMACQIAR